MDAARAGHRTAPHPHREHRATASPVGRPDEPMGHRSSSADRQPPRLLPPTIRRTGRSGGAQDP